MNPDVWFKVFESLGIKELFNIRTVCKELKTVVDDNPCLFWYKHHELIKSTGKKTNDTHSDGYYETVKLLYFSIYRCSLDSTERTDDTDVPRSFYINLL